jgi:outer membrane protein assembly factor BamA
MMLAGCVAARAQATADRAAPAPESPPVSLISVSPSDVPAPLALDPDVVAPDAPKPPPGVPPKERKTEVVAAPIPISNPTIGTGLGAVGALLFPLTRSDTISPPAVGGLGGFYTDSNSFGFGLAMRAYLAEDHWRALAGGAYGKFHYDVFPIGIGPGSDAKSIPIVQEVTGLSAEALRRVSETFLVGARYRYVQTNLKIESGDLGSEAAPPERDFSVPLAALGLRVQSDSRDSTFYPLKGALFDLNADFYDPAFGSRRVFQSYKAYGNVYVSTGERQVLAARLSACSVRGDAPFYALCLFGMKNDLRGYQVGKYLNRAMLAAQAEYRLSLPESLGFFGHFGFVGFAGVGEVAPGFGDFTSENLLPSAGLGVRYLLAKQNRVNFRLDYAWGKAGNRGLYVGVGEAF